MNAVGLTVARIIDATEEVRSLTRDGSRARHEAEMALISLRNLQKEIDLWQEAKAGELAPVARPGLRLVK